MSDGNTIEQYLGGRNAGLWTDWLGGDISSAVFISDLRDSCADEAEMKYAKQAAACDSEFAQIAGETIAAIGETARERALRLVYGKAGSGFSFESLVIPVAIGAAVGAMVFIDDLTNLPYMGWGALACGAVYGLYYAAKAFYETRSVCRVGMIRY